MNQKQFESIAKLLLLMCETNLMVVINQLGQSGNFNESKDIIIELKDRLIEIAREIS